MTISVQKLNRPSGFGAENRRELISQDSEVAFRSQNDASGNPIYLGRAKAGVLTSAAKWQIQYLTYDASDSITSIEWPQNADGNASTEYEFVWDDRLTLTYS